MNEIVLPAAPIFDRLRPPMPPAVRKHEGLVVSLMTVRPTVELKLALAGEPLTVGVPFGR